jgi:hypothetical protein
VTEMQNDRACVSRAECWREALPLREGSIRGVKWKGRGARGWSVPEIVEATDITATGSGWRDGGQVAAILMVEVQCPVQLRALPSQGVWV